MKAAIIRKYGGNDVIEISSDLPEPKYSPDEVLIQVKSASVNPIDWKVMQGAMKLLVPIRFPFILGNDGSGVIKEIGANVKRFKKGDEVYFRPNSMKQTGTFAQFISVHEKEIALKPKSISFQEAAGIPLVGLTSLQALREYAELKSGQKVLIHAGSGGVGSIAIQIAKAMGLHVASTTSTTNLELVKSLGADIVIDYKTENFWEKLKDYDSVFDTIGEDTKQKSFQVIKKGGSLVSIYGMPTAKSLEKFNVNFLLNTLFHILNYKTTSTAKKFGVRYEFFLMHPDGNQLSEIAAWVDAKKIKPIVDKVFPLENVKDAFAYQQTGRAKGKIIIEIDKN